MMVSNFLEHLQLFWRKYAHSDFGQGVPGFRRSDNERLLICFQVRISRNLRGGVPMDYSESAEHLQTAATAEWGGE